jgi:hypothetical protein
MTRLEWFKSKIGQRIYRNDTGCCKHCQTVFKDGLIVHDEMHATYLYEIEITCQHEGHKLMYFETKQQALNYESWVKK